MNEQLLTMPRGRIGGLFSPANSRVVTRAFAMPAGTLYLNGESFLGLLLLDVLCGSLSLLLSADASFHRNANEHSGVFGCDMACQAYIQVGVVSEGMGAMGDDSCVVQIRDVDSTRIPLRCAGRSRHRG